MMMYDIRQFFLDLLREIKRTLNNTNEDRSRSQRRKDFFQRRRDSRSKEKNDRVQYELKQLTKFQKDFKSIYISHISFFVKQKYKNIPYNSFINNKKVNENKILVAHLRLNHMVIYDDGSKRMFKRHFFLDSTTPKKFYY